MYRILFLCHFLLQANGLDERFNQTLQNMLRKYVTDRKDDWDSFLDTCTFAYNTSRHESTLFSPFEVMFGRKPVLPVDLDVSSPNAAKLLEEKKTDTASGYGMESLVSQRQNLLIKVRIFLLNFTIQPILFFFSQVKSNIHHAQQKQEEQYNKKHSTSRGFKVGEIVLKKDFTRKKRKGGKLDSKWVGPYYIREDLGKGFFKLELVKTHGVTVERVNGSHLKLYREPER